MDWLLQNIKTYADFPKAGVLYRDLNPLFRDPKALKRTIIALSAPFVQESFDGVAAIEARGFLFGVLVAQLLDMPFILIRKEGKLPGKVARTLATVEYGEAVLEVQENAIEQNMRLLLVDDVLASGGTAKAAIDLLGQLGAKVFAAAFVVELADLSGRTHLPVPTYSLLQL
jgi:adenine phosphoribosyltransferase